MKKNSLFSIMIATVILFSSCATTVSVKKIQPANFDIKDAKSIAILPFETSAPTGSDFSKNLNSFISIIDAIVSLDSATSEQNYIVSYLEESFKRLKNINANNYSYMFLSSTQITVLEHHDVSLELSHYLYEGAPEIYAVY